MLKGPLFQSEGAQREAETASYLWSEAEKLGQGGPIMMEALLESVKTDLLTRPTASTGAYHWGPTCDRVEVRFS